MNTTKKNCVQDRESRTHNHPFTSSIPVCLNIYPIRRTEEDDAIRKRTVDEMAIFKGFSRKGLQEAA
jgi:hypothetical protein